jgi:hypothetical protein
VLVLVLVLVLCRVPARAGTARVLGSAGTGSARVRVSAGRSVSAESPGAGSSSEASSAGTPADASALHPEWSAVLDELESQLDDAERTLMSAGPDADASEANASEPTATEATGLTATGTMAPDHLTSPSAAPLPWAPPTGLGPMPAALSDRASSVLARQSVLVARLVEARSAVQQQLGAVRRVEASHEPARPVYLDALG